MEWCWWVKEGGEKDLATEKAFCYPYALLEKREWIEPLRKMGLAARKQNRLQVEVKLGTNSVIVGVWALYLTEDTQLES